MLNKMIAKNLTFSKQVLLNSQRCQGFAALSQSILDKALSNPTHINWGQFFTEVKASDLAESDLGQVGKLLKVLTYASTSKEAENQKELYHAIDEYFRKKFRKIQPQ